MNEFRIALSTCPPDASDQIAKELVQKRICACVNIIRGLSSTYHWKGKIETETEDLLFMKTTSQRVQSLKQALVKAHPYEIPEFIVIPIIQGHSAYLDWIAQSVDSESVGD
jgi:periplasmic divalent cation tolerance protein